MTTNRNCLYTPKEISELLKIRLRGVYRLIAQGRITALRVGRQLRVLDSDLSEYLTEMRNRGRRQ